MSEKSEKVKALMLYQLLKLQNKSAYIHLDFLLVWCLQLKFGLKLPKATIVLHTML